MYTVARFLQLCGLVIVPVALFYGIRGGSTRGVAMRELTIMAIGALIFLAGRALESKVQQ